MGYKNLVDINLSLDEHFVILLNIIKFSLFII